MKMKKKTKKKYEQKCPECDEAIKGISKLHLETVLEQHKYLLIKMPKEKKRYWMHCPECDEKVTGFSEHHLTKVLAQHRQTSKSHKEKVALLKKKREEYKQGQEG